MKNIEESEQHSCENCLVKKLNELDALSKEELRMISKQKESRNFKKGEVIFKEGQRLTGVYCIRKGASKLSKTSQNGNAQILKLAAKGQILGQSAMVSDEKTNFSATAVDDTEVCFIPQSSLFDKLNKNPAFIKEILKSITEDLKQSNNAQLGLAQKSIKQRLAISLFYIQENFGVDKDGCLGLILSRVEIAELVGTVKAPLIRTLSEFNQNGWVELKGKRIKIKDPSALKRLIERN